MKTRDEKPAPAVLIASLLATLPCSAAASDAAVASLAALERQAEAVVRDAFEQPGVDARATPLDSRLRLARCAEAPRAQIVSAGSARLLVRLQCAGTTPWTVHVPVSVESELTTFRVVRPLARGTRPGVQDVASERRRVQGTAVDYVTDLSQIAQQDLRRPLASGSLLKHADFETAPVLKRGEIVTLVAQAQGVEVRQTGRALADARLGQRVRVRNEASQRVVEGSVSAQRVVEIAP